MNSEESKSLQDEFDDILPSFGLKGWQVVLIPDETKEVGGQVLSEEKTILIFEKCPEKARDALLHEVVEILFQPMIAEYQETINGLIRVIERLTYREKERVIKKLVPELRHVFEDKNRVGFEK